MEIKIPDENQRAMLNEFLNVLTADLMVFSLSKQDKDPGDVSAAIISALGCMLADFVRTAPFSQEHKDEIMTATLHIIKMRFEHGEHMPNPRG